MAIAATAGSLASVQAEQFYQSLDRPSWAPPPPLFGQVWTVLYIAMAIAVCIVWRARGWRGAPVALALFCAQLVPNALWSWLFFAWRKGALALLDIGVMWLLVLATMIAFWRISAVAGALLLPYLAWVTLAAALNYEVWRRNPALLG